MKSKIKKALIFPGLIKPFDVYPWVESANTLMIGIARTNQNCCFFVSIVQN